MPRHFNYERASAALVDASLFGDKVAAEKYGVSVKSIEGWRKRLSADQVLKESFLLRAQRVEKTSDLSNVVSIKEKLLKPDLVYFVLDAASRAVKIGVSKDPENRLVLLQSGNPNKLEIICCVTGGYKLEGQLHKQFDDYRIHGEWFNYCGDVQVYVQSVQKHHACQQSLNLAVKSIG